MSHYECEDCGSVDCNGDCKKKQSDHNDVTNIVSKLKQHICEQEKTISILRADLARVTAEREQVKRTMDDFQEHYERMEAERDRATAAAAAMRVRLERARDEWIPTPMDGIEQREAREDVDAFLASTDVGAAYAREHEEMRALLGRALSLLTAGGLDFHAMRGLADDIERVLKDK